VTERVCCDKQASHRGKKWEEAPETQTPNGVGGRNKMFQGPRVCVCEGVRERVCV
jgi:hypothetical protein